MLGLRAKSLRPYRCIFSLHIGRFVQVKTSGGLIACIEIGVRAVKIRGVLFDKDGTLFDFDATWGVWTKAMLSQETDDPVMLARLADVLGYDLNRSCFHPGSLVIAETTDVVADAIISVLPELEKSSLIARMAQQSADVTQVPVGDLQAIMTALRAMDLQLGIATNDNEAPARANVAQADIIDDFAVILGSDSGFGGKPATGQLDQFCSVTGLAPAQCLMVGDSLHDLHAGATAGMIPVGVLTGPALRETLEPHARVVLGSIAELPAWIASID